MVGIEIDKQDQFREQSVPIISQIEVQEIETAHKSGRVPMFPIQNIASGCGSNVAPRSFEENRFVEPL